MIAYPDQVRWGWGKQAAGGPDGTVRVIRGWLTALSSAALAIAAHGVAEGGLPDASVTVVVTVLIGWASTALADRVRGTRGILTLLGVGQLLMHLTLTVLDAHPDAGVEVAPLTMLSTHVLAIVATAVLLDHAERGLRAVTGCLRRLLPVVFSPVTPAVAPAPAVLPAATCGAVEVLLTRVHARRGPPARS